MNTSSSSEDGDPLREARAYNQSIYLMAGMPYLLLGTVGLMIYRGYKAAQKAEARLPSQTAEEQNEPLDGGEGPHSPTKAHGE
jgi:hypothetical protein